MISSRIRSLSRALLLSGFIAAGVADAATVILTPVADTSLFQVSSLNNMGAVQSLAAGNTARNEIFRALVKFDVASSVPSGATVTGASLELTVVRAPGGAQPAEFALHRMLVDWGEGSKGVGNLIGTGEPATDGESSWSFRFHPTLGWAEAGGGSGDDYMATATAIAPTVITGPVSYASSPELIADVQGWLVAPSSNFGWMIKERSESTAATARRLGSREHPTDPPRLQIDYELPFRIASVEVRGGEICVRFTARAGKSYVIERRSSVEAGEWMPVRTLPAAETTEEVAVCEGLEGGNYFYRVGEQ